MYIMYREQGLCAQHVCAACVRAAVHSLPLAENTHLLYSYLQHSQIQVSPPASCRHAPAMWSWGSELEQHIWIQIENLSLKCQSVCLVPIFWVLSGASSATHKAHGTAQPSSIWSPKSEGQLYLFAFWMEPAAEIQIPLQESGRRAKPNLSPEPPSTEPAPPGRALLLRRAWGGDRGDFFSLCSRCDSPSSQEWLQGGWAEAAKPSLVSQPPAPRLGAEGCRKTSFSALNAVARAV